MQFLIGAILAFGVVWLRRTFGSFHAQKPDDYDHIVPAFDMRTHLNGRMICEGAIFGPAGRVTSTFKAVFDITWEGDTATMAEHFVYDNSTVQDREWRITMQGNDRFTATAEDVPGTGKGQLSGNAVLFRYPIRLPEDTGGHVLNAFDCMYLAPNDTIVNRSQFRKYGFKVAELVATIRPARADEE